MKEIQETKTKAYLDCIKFAQNFNQVVGEDNKYFVTIEQLENILKDACPYSCGFQEPYGFVPEADCPVHDSITL